MAVYYNEWDSYCAQWLRNLIGAGHLPAGDVDERSIADVHGGDLAGYSQCHFFAGIGGWSHALKLAQWPEDRPVWTGSCPCQPFSVAGRQKGEADERHLWPEFRRLIAECRPATVFGEQVANAASWLTGVRGDLEALGYAVGCHSVEAASCGAPHKRDRLWFVANAAEPGQGRRRVPRPGQGTGTNLQRSSGEPSGPSLGSLGHADAARLQGRGVHPERAGQRTAWSAGVEWFACADGKQRRVKSGVRLLAHGIPARVGRLRAYGNAIVPQVAAEFIRAAMP